MAPIVLHFLSTKVVGFVAEISLFRQLCFVLDLIQGMKQGRMALVGLFTKAALIHFKDTVRIYGSDIVIPKHHAAAMHLAKQFWDDYIVLDTLPVERLHQVPKGFRGVVKNLDQFDKAVLVRLLAHQRNHLERFEERTHLQGPINEGDDFNLSKSMYVQGLTITMEDVVMLPDNGLAVVECCGNADDEFFIIGTV